MVREYVEAFNRGDLRRLKELLADDAEVQGVAAELARGTRSFVDRVRLRSVVFLPEERKGIVGP